MTRVQFPVGELVFYFFDFSWLGLHYGRQREE
jgi:hypothetical protein